MDPEATIRQIELELRDRDFGNAVQLMSDYYQWRLKGGAQPLNGDTRVASLTLELVETLDSGLTLSPSA